MTNQKKNFLSKRAQANEKAEWTNGVRAVFNALFLRRTTEARVNVSICAIIVHNLIYVIFF